MFAFNLCMGMCAEFETTIGFVSCALYMPQNTVHINLNVVTTLAALGELVSLVFTVSV